MLLETYRVDDADSQALPFEARVPARLPLADTRTSKVHIMTNRGYCSTTFAEQPVSLARVPTLDGAFQ